LHTWLVPRRESEALLAQARAQIEPIVASDPQAITVHPSIASREVILRYRGLAFARWDDGAIFFGCNDMHQELTPASRAAFECMMQDLGRCRHPLASFISRAGGTLARVSGAKRRHSRG
jgi:hypothetical protein